MFREKLNQKWMFYPTIENPLYGTYRSGIEVDLPHDFSILQQRDPSSPAGAASGFYPGGIGCYTKSLYIPKEWTHNRISLYFEGVYMNAAVYVNDHLVKRQYYGYTSFNCDITPFINFDADNLIKVEVNNSAVPSSRWYTGSGIYRNVWLEVRDQIHISCSGVFFQTPQVSDLEARIKIETTVENHRASNETIELHSILIDSEGVEVGGTVQKFVLAAHSTTALVQEFSLNKPHLWSVDDPYLYTLQSKVIQNGKVFDTVLTNVGIRSISFDAKDGFKLNGKPMKLKGGCVHHDCGILGAAAYERAEERKVELLKQSGFNAVRCAHNPPSPAFLDACDRLGMLVIDEAFDCWRENKVLHGYGNHFEHMWKADLQAMIVRDRNHPSIIMWSTGNEVIEQDGRSGGNQLSKELADYVRSLDNTRAVTHALYPIPNVNNQVDQASLEKGGDAWGKTTEKFAEPLDVVGYNYLLHRYGYDGEQYPERIICGTETFPSQAFDYWQEVERHAHVIGDFVWTAIDYLGEAGIGYVHYGGGQDPRGYPWLTAYCGDLDICGFKRPQSYYRDCVWGVAKEPYIAVHPPQHYGKNPMMTPWSWPDVLPAWDWPGFEGKPIKIDVYCIDTEVELFLNGRSLGRKQAGRAQKYTASFETVYEPGELVAVSYENGREKARKSLITPGKPVELRLTADRIRLKPELGDLSYLTVEVVDGEGNLIHRADNKIYFTVHGVGRLIAVGNSDPKSEEPFVGNQRKVYHGRALAVVRSNGEPGEIVLTASADGFKPAAITITVGE